MDQVIEPVASPQRDRYEIKENHPMPTVLKIGVKYLFTAQIESIIYLETETVEIRTPTERHMFTGTDATALKTYLDGLAQFIS